MYNTKKIYGAVLFWAASLFIFFSCDKREIIHTSKRKDFPSRRIFNAKITEKDSGEVKYYLTAPLIEEYGFLKTPVMLFPKGLKIIFYNKKDGKKGTFRAKYAKMIDKKDYYFARGKVHVVTPEGDTMKTNSFQYNKATKMLYTKDTVKIIRLDGSIIFANEGLEACEDFSCYELYENKNSKVMVKE